MFLQSHFPGSHFPRPFTPYTYICIFRIPSPRTICTRPVILSVAELSSSSSSSRLQHKYSDNTSLRIYSEISRKNGTWYHQLDIITISVFKSCVQDNPFCVGCRTPLMPLARRSVFCFVLPGSGLALQGISGILSSLLYSVGLLPCRWFHVTYHVLHYMSRGYISSHVLHHMLHGMKSTWKIAKYSDSGNIFRYMQGKKKRIQNIFMFFFSVALKPCVYRQVYIFTQPKYSKVCKTMTSKNRNVCKKQKTPTDTGFCTWLISTNQLPHEGVTWCVTWYITWYNKVPVFHESYLSFLAGLVR